MADNVHVYFALSSTSTAHVNHLIRSVVFLTLIMVPRSHVHVYNEASTWPCKILVHDMYCMFSFTMCRPPCQQPEVQLVYLLLLLLVLRVMVEMPLGPDVTLEEASVPDQGAWYPSSPLTARPGALSRQTCQETCREMCRAWCGMSARDFVEF